MTTLNTYAVTYQVDTFETKKEYEQYGADSTEIYDDQFQASSDAQAIFQGLILVIAVTIDGYRARKIIL